MSRSQDLGSTVGKDIKFDFDSMDISLEGSAVSIIEGKGNLSQAVALRLMTPVGHLPFHRTYGSRVRQLLGRPQSKGIPTIAEMYVGEALMRESRITAVESIETKQVTDAITIKITAYSEDEEVVNVTTKVTT